MSKETLKQILKDLKKEGTVIYPYLQLTEEDKDVLDELDVSYEQVKLHLSYLLMDGTYEVNAWKLSCED